MKRDRNRALQKAIGRQNRTLCEFPASPLVYDARLLLRHVLDRCVCGLFRGEGGFPALLLLAFFGFFGDDPNCRAKEIYVNNVFQGDEMNGEDACMTYWAYLIWSILSIV